VSRLGELCWCIIVVPSLLTMTLSACSSSTKPSSASAALCTVLVLPLRHLLTMALHVRSETLRLHALEEVRKWPQHEPEKTCTQSMGAWDQACLETCCSLAFARNSSRLSSALS
jgi:hypothetical protein